MRRGVKILGEMVDWRRRRLTLDIRNCQVSANSEKSAFEYAD